MWLKKRTNQPSSHCSYHTVCIETVNVSADRAARLRMRDSNPPNSLNSTKNPAVFSNIINVIYKDTVFSSFTRLDGYSPLCPAAVCISLLDWVCLNNLLLKQSLVSLWQIVRAMDFSQSRIVLWKKKTRQESGVWFAELSANGKVVDTGETPSQKAKDQTTEAAVGIQNPRQTDTEV